MKRTIAVLATIGVLALACASQDPEPTTTSWGTTNTALSEPWNSMGLPVSPAEVVVSDKTIALLVYDGADFGALGQAWRTAWTDSGWTAADQFSDEGFDASIYQKDGKEIGWAMGSDQGTVVVYLEDLSLVPAEASTVRQAKTGTRKITRTTRPSTQGTSKGSGKTALPREGSTGGGGALPKSGSSGGSSGGNSKDGALPRGGSGSGSGGSGGGGGSLPR